MLDLGQGRVAEAGVVGVLKTCLLQIGNTGDLTKGKDKVVGVEKSGDLPTKDFSAAMLEYSKPGAGPSAIGFHDSLNCGMIVGEPMADEDTEAPDSEDASRTGGISWKEWEME